MIFPSGYYKKTTAILIFLMAVVFFSCKNDMETIKSLEDPETVPQLTMIHPEILHYSSSRLQARLKAPEILRFERGETPGMEFPKGLSIEFYDEQLMVRGKITANYARYDERKRLWEARYNVEAINSAGDKLNTEQLFWDEVTQKVYSEKFTKITNPEGVFIGEGGFTADQQNGDFTGWTLFSSKGTLSIKESVSQDSLGAQTPDPGLPAVDSISVSAPPFPSVTPADSSGSPASEEFSALRQRFSKRLLQNKDSVKSLSQ